MHLLQAQELMSRVPKGAPPQELLVRFRQLSKSISLHVNIAYFVSMYVYLYARILYIFVPGVYAGYHRAIATSEEARHNCQRQH